MKFQVHNFNAGPSVLPKPVLQQAQAELLDYRGHGMSIMEMSHRSAAFDELMAEVQANVRRLMAIPDNYKMLFLQGGASLQFSMVPMNLLSPDGSADYIVNGAWGQKALKEAGKVGKARAAASTADTNFDRLPAADDIQFDRSASYVHFTSNETIHGIQWHSAPETLPDIPVICDMSSDILSRPLDVSKYGLIYAGAQKNAGPSGVTLVIVRDDLLERVNPSKSNMLDYRLQAEKNSLFNTPPSFSIYLLGLVLQWLIDQGGLNAIARRNAHKAQLLYQVIDGSGGFYSGHAMPEDRSLMNVTFRMESAELERAFAEAALDEGMVGLKGHRSVGGLRASIYNACPVESVEILAGFMVEFERKHG